MNHLLVPKGFSFTGVACGIAKKPGKLDLGVIYSHVPAPAAAVFTVNKVKAAPILFSMGTLKKGVVQVVIANSGNANACTGKQGMADSRETASLIAEGLRIKQEHVVVASTGVIGVPLPMGRVRSGIKKVIATISTGPQHLAYFSQAIMTTDTKSKVFSVQELIDGKEVTITGIAKGSGMIHPNMATMLAFILTDACIAPNVLRASLKASVDKSFHLLTVDGDTSTNDMVILVANGQAENSMIRSGKGAQLFQRHLDKVCIELAKMIARDGEGAHKYVEIRVKGAKDFCTAKAVAMAIGKSSLVKTALYGNDPNWGRIIAAVGYSGVEITPEKIDIFFKSGKGSLQVCKRGMDTGFDEEKARKIMNHKELHIVVNLHLGKAEATGFTCDLTEGYIDINASYRT